MGNSSSCMFYAPKDFQYESITMDGTLKIDSTDILALEILDRYSHILGRFMNRKHRENQTP